MELNMPQELASGPHPRFIEVVVFQNELSLIFAGGQLQSSFFRLTTIPHHDVLTLLLLDD